MAGTSTLIREYVWFEGAPIAVIEGGVVYYVRSDHIGKPVFATDATGTKVWEATYLPFGGVHTSSGANINLRFPGQWFQSESGLHQNWMRDYDPTTGRYIQVDPLGLVDGASVYGYVRQNPGRYIDPRGEYFWIPVWGYRAWQGWRAYRLGATGVAVIGGTAAGVPSTPVKKEGEKESTTPIEGEMCTINKGNDCIPMLKQCLSSSLAGKGGRVRGSSRCVTCADKCEQTGFWPNSYRTVYGGNASCAFWKR